MKFISVAAAAALSLYSTTAFAAGSSGQAMAVIDQANASGTTGERALEVGSQIFVGDTVATDAGGEAQLRFNDGTRMVVGPNSSLVIDQALFRSDAAENKFTIRALGGAFRFISGDGGDNGFKIRTPSATLGIRGTAFDFSVAPDGKTTVVLLEGEVTLCGDGKGKKDEDRDCETVATPCAVLQTDDEEDVEEVALENGRTRVIRENLPYTESDDKLLDDFRVAGHGCVNGGLSQQALQSTAIPTEAIIIGGVVILGGVIIGILGSNSSSNSTNN